MAGTGFDHQRYGQDGGGLHHLLSYGGKRLRLRLRRLEQQFIMHLEQQPGFQPGSREGGGQLHHGALDDVGGAALQRGVDCLTLGVAAPRRVLIGDAGDPDTSAERAGDVAVPAALAGAKLKARMLLQVHDELLFEVPEPELNKTKEMARTVMESAATLSVPLVVDTGVGLNWAAAH